MRNRKRKLTKLSVKEWKEQQKNKDLFETPEGYDAHWIEVYDDNGNKTLAMGTSIGCSGEITLEELKNNTEEVLEFMSKHEEVAVLDENGKTLFYANKL